MSPIGAIKGNWRVLLLGAFLVFAVVALFIPGGIVADDGLASDSVDSGPTNLEFGLGLEGGSRIRVPVAGMTAEDIDTGAVSDDGTVDQERIDGIESTLQSELDLDQADVSVAVQDDGTVTAEVFNDNVSESEFAAALQTADIDATEDDIRDGVTQSTRDNMIRTIQTKINAAGLSGGTAYESTTVSGDHYIVVEVPNMDADELRTILSERGQVKVVAYHPENGTQTNDTVLRGEDIVEVDPPEQNPRGSGYFVPVQVSEDAAPGFQQQMVDLGFTTEGQGQCSLSGDSGSVDFDHDGQQYCLLTVVDDEVVDAHSMGDLANPMNEGSWENDPTFQMGAPSQEQAQSLSVNLRAGSLRAPLDFSEEQVYSIEPGHADQFKQYSLLIGLLSVLTVSGVVYARYTDTRVALPMIVTAIAEVVILLGFAALIRMPLDLSHVAGFIAVVGTGVDDLVIIADEVMDEGDVSSERVFQSRFRKAFWVIGAAAATTVVALSPLAVLSLGDLRGFAIITILGVFIGVLITRPAYGDILRRLLTDR
ncbi:preprotein translocase subunit SecD [Natrinema pellirubrum DSM 15624]|uniref:Protein-export membrane protein SecD n=1 Tax=Natrinema pellirubrum (strain DSM 15624 / CIP 106293 / JCM 10476 / NCIMB 786 / 157) TaxID=797303 RepID=L0JR26_NATP1|nr:preprotein translocase subunit SecD [Natrinema pellirubrum]AGB33268.1 preprotein translocase subunit SecD [Natrinema pellirubrum DSM 15624]ELY71634.1 preprotein translocase subunit SecD [Natrinema pellirubrum DSM 15624]